MWFPIGSCTVFMQILHQNTLEKTACEQGVRLSLQSAARMWTKVVWTQTHSLQVPVVMKLGWGLKTSILMSLLQALTALCLVLLLGERDPRAPQKIRELGCKYVKNPSIVYSRRKKHIFRKCTPKWSITKWNNLYYIPHRHLKTIHRDIFHN